MKKIDVDAATFSIIFGYMVVFQLFLEEMMGCAAVVAGLAIAPMRAVVEKNS